MRNAVRTRSTGSRDAADAQHASIESNIPNPTDTGDAGLVVCLWHCVDGRAELPALDVV